MPIKQEVTEALQGEWQVGLFETPCKAPLPFCLGCICTCCMAAQQRHQILDVIGEPYVCCGGLFPCGPLGEPQDRNCVYAEACCCTGLSISANRFLIQTRFDRMNTACDDCILWSVCLASWAVCLLQCVGVDVPEEIENLVDCAIITVDGCMLGQQQVEIEHVEKSGYAGPPAHLIGMMPPFQQQMMATGKPPQHQMGGPVPGMGPGPAMAMGAMAGGAAGAAAAYGMGGGRPQQAAAPPQVFGAKAGGFMSTLAPNGMEWSRYCQGQQAMVDHGSGFVVGAWGECLAYAKVLEHQSPDWPSNPDFAPDGPAGQVCNAMQAAAPGTMRASVSQACEKLEQACEAAARSGQPFPVINYRL